MPDLSPSQTDRFLMIKENDSELRLDQLYKLTLEDPAFSRCT
jgi:hypothetical protein